VLLSIPTPLTPTPLSATLPPFLPRLIPLLQLLKKVPLCALLELLSPSLSPLGIHIVSTPGVYEFEQQPQKRQHPSNLETTSMRRKPFGSK
jgi:hypothetical protein